MSLKRRLRCGLAPLRPEGTESTPMSGTSPGLAHSPTPAAVFRSGETCPDLPEAGSKRALPPDTPGALHTGPWDRVSFRVGAQCVSPTRFLPSISADPSPTSICYSFLYKTGRVSLPLLRATSAHEGAGRGTKACLRKMTCRQRPLRRSLATLIKIQSPTTPTSAQPTSTSINVTPAPRQWRLFLEFLLLFTFRQKRVGAIGSHGAKPLVCE